MTKDEFRNLVVERVTALGGVKGVALAADQELIQACFDASIENLPDIFDELVKEKRIAEIEYVRPDMNYRLKSFYLPIGTQITRLNNIKCD